jgi:putative transposase
MVLNGAGMMVEKWWNELPKKFIDIRLDEYVVMPNHMHGIIEIIDTNKTRAPTRDAPTGNDESHVGVPLVGTLDYSHIGEIIGAFKSFTTNEYIQGVDRHNWPCFPRRLWQRNYWERIIRNDQELHDTRDYIRNNPAQWMLDDLYAMY